MKLLLAILLLAAASGAQTVQQYTKSGDAAFQAKDYDKAVQSYVQAIKLEPESAELYDKLGEVYRAQHNQRYIVAFKKAEELRAKQSGGSGAVAPASASPSQAVFAASAEELAAAKKAHAAGDYATALKMFHPLAQKGDGTAQFALGLMYESGHGVPKDMRQALDWYEKSAKQKNPQALSNLGYVFAEGKGVPRNPELARKLYREAADLGVASAMYSLGTMDYSGDGGPMDYVSAWVWWKRAANLNHAKSSANIAKLEAQMNAEQLRQARLKYNEAVGK